MKTAASLSTFSSKTPAATKTPQPDSESMKTIQTWWAWCLPMNLRLILTLYTEKKAKSPLNKVRSSNIATKKFLCLPKEMNPSPWFNSRKRLPQKTLQNTLLSTAGEQRRMTSTCVQVCNLKSRLNLISEITTHLTQTGWMPPLSLLSSTSTMRMQAWPSSQESFQRRLTLLT